MVQSLQAAVPGQSLTDEPKNYPWERPPEVADPADAITYHLERITTPEILDNILFTLEFGMPTKHMAEIMCTGAVADGIHSVDVSLIIAPVIQEYLNATAKQAGIPFKEDFNRDEENKRDAEAKALLLLRKSLTKNKDTDEGAEYLEQLASSAKEQAEEAPMEMEQQEEPMVPEMEEAPKGLMARG